MELQQLDHFLAIVECGSIKVAARKVGLSPSALTRSLQALERSLGVTLFARSLDGMKPNDFARSLERHARAIAIKTDRAHQEIRELLESEREHITVGAGPTFALAVLPLAIPRFVKAQPRIEVSVVEGYRADMLAGLRSGALDCLFLTVSGVPMGEDLASETLLRGERIVIVASRAHPLVGRDRCSVEEIWAGSWLLPGPSNFFQAALFRLFDDAGLPPPRAAAEYTSIPMANALLANGTFLAFTSELLVRQEVEDQSLTILNVEDLASTRDIGVLYRRDIPLRPAASELLRHVKGVCREFRSGRGTTARRRRDARA